MDSNTIKGAVIGGLAGLAVAIGGAIKDAPYEGFEVKKFIRSPIIGAIAGAILYSKFPDLHPAVGFTSVIGIERIVVEMYKLIRALRKEYVPMKFIYGEWGIPKQLTPEGWKRLTEIQSKKS